MISLRISGKRNSNLMKSIWLYTSSFDHISKVDCIVKMSDKSPADNNPTGRLSVLSTVTTETQITSKESIRRILYKPAKCWPIFLVKKNRRVPVRSARVRARIAPDRERETVWLRAKAEAMERILFIYETLGVYARREKFLKKSRTRRLLDGEPKQFREFVGHCQMLHYYWLATTRQKSRTALLQTLRMCAGGSYIHRFPRLWSTRIFWVKWAISIVQTNTTIQQFELRIRNLPN